MKYLEKAKKNRWIIALLIIAAFLRFCRLGFQSAWLDEMHTLKATNPNLSLTEFHEMIMFREGIPHFYFLIVRFFCEIFGHTILVARIPSALAGIATVWFVYLLGKELYSKNAGLIAAAFLTFNLYHVEFSQEARSYSILAFFTTLAFYYLVKFIRSITIKNAMLLGLFAGLITNAQPIGLVNVGAIYIILFLALYIGEAKDTQKLLRYTSLSGIVALVVFSPVLQIVLKVAEIKNMWIPEPTYETVTEIVVMLSGRSKIVMYIVLFCITFVFLMTLVKIKETKKIFNNQLFFAFLILFFWIAIGAGVIILKSIIGESITLHRYFIGILPAMMLFIGVGIDFIKNNSAKIAAVAIVIGCMLIPWFSPHFYYITYTKSQFDKVTFEIQKKYSNDYIVSEWWPVSNYFDNNSKYKTPIEQSLASYIMQIKNGSTMMTSFWYISGNARPYTLNPELEQYMSENFTITDKIEMFDAWAYHYKVNDTSSNGVMNLAKFESAMFDGSNAMIFVENKTVKSSPMFLEKGKYKLTIKGKSLPEVPINNENAHFNLLIDGVKVGEFSLSESKDYLSSEVHFEVGNSKEVVLELNYDNDTVLGASDRNAVVQMIKIERE